MASNDLKLLIHTANAPQTGDKPPVQRTRRGVIARRIRAKSRLSFQERLLRNSFIACALLLGVLALGNLQTPWAVEASKHIEQALTMNVDLDQSLGQLSFVRELMPESALVFFNLSGAHAYAQPVQGTLSHPFSEAQPWLMFACAESSAVCAATDGTVSAVSPLSDGSFGVLIDHGDGLESVTANLREVKVQPGDKLPRGGMLGVSATDIYFELRQAQQSIDPTERMGL